MYSDSIFPEPILRIPAYLPCKYEGMGMHNVDTSLSNSVTGTSNLKIPEIYFD